MSKHPVWIVLGGICALVIAMGLSRFAYTPILPVMKKAIGFTEAAAGYLASSNFLGYLAGAWWAGTAKWMKRRETALRWNLFLNILSLAGMGLTANYLLWLLLRFVAGVTSGLIFVFSSGIVLDRLAQAERQEWAGLFYSGVGLGILLSALGVPIFHHYYGWRGTWNGLAALASMLGIIVWKGLREEREDKLKTWPTAVQTRQKLRPILSWLIPVYGLEGMSYIVSGTFLVDMIAENPALKGLASLSWAMVGLAAIPSAFLWALSARKIGYLWALTLAYLLQAIGILLPVLSPFPAGTLAGTVLFGGTFMGITTLAATFARQIEPDNSHYAIGILTAAYGIGQMLGPSAAGIFITRTGSYSPALFFSASVLPFAVLLLWSGVWHTTYKTKKGRKGCCVPYVNIKITKEGATTEQKQKLIEGVTNLLKDVLGKNPQTTVVVIEEVDTDNWGIGGETVTVRRMRGQ